LAICRRAAALGKSNSDLSIGSPCHAKVLINLTSVDVNAAIAAINSKVGYVGVCWTSDHADFYHKELVRRIFQSMKEDNSPLFEPEVKALLSGKKATTKAAMAFKQPSPSRRQLLKYQTCSNFSPSQR
jgi:hypothetical protein